MLATLVAPSIGSSQTQYTISSESVIMFSRHIIFYARCFFHYYKDYFVHALCPNTVS